MAQGVLALNVSVPGLGKRFMLTKTLEWNLNWCLLDTMLDHNFQIKEDFTHDIARLQWRFRCSLSCSPVRSVNLVQSRCILRSASSTALKLEEDFQFLESLTQNSMVCAGSWPS